MKQNTNEERSIKHIRESMDLLKKENAKLKQENKTISTLKNTISKLQEEKMELSRKLMEMESEAVLYKAEEDPNDEMLYNPRRGSRFSTISQKELLQKLQPNSSNFIEPKKFSNLSKISNYFSIISKKSINLLKDGLKNKNEEILLLKNELVKKEQTILELKKNNEKYNSIFDSKYSLNSSINININSDEKKIQNKPEEYLNLLSRRFSFKKNSDLKEINDSIYEENEAHLLLEKNIYSEIQNILEEKRNFILKTLTCENFSFDILNSNINNNNFKSKKRNEKNKESVEEEINGTNIEQILELIRQRKRKVEMTRKYLEEKMV